MPSSCFTQSAVELHRAVELQELHRAALWQQPLLAPLSDVASVSMDSSSSESVTIMTSSDAPHTGTDSNVSSPAHSSLSAPTDSLPAHSGSTPSASDHNVSPSDSHMVEESASVCNNTASTDTTASNRNVCESAQVTESQLPKAPLQPVVISCTRPDGKGSKGMKQILEHFLHQNKANTTVSADSGLQNMLLRTNLDSAGASTSDSSDVKPQLVPLSDVDSSSSVLSVPSLSRKNSSVVFILRRTGCQTGGAQCAGKASLCQTPVSSSGQKTTTALDLSRSNNKEDEIDGTVTDSVSSLMGTADNMSSSESAASSVSVVEQCCSSECHAPPQSTVVTTNSDAGDSSSQYQCNNVSDSSSQHHCDNVSDSSSQYQCTANSDGSDGSSQYQCTANSDGSDSSSQYQCTANSDGSDSSSQYHCNNVSDSSSQYQWVQIQLPTPIVEAGQTAGGETGDDLQKLIPLTVKEKLSADLCRPIIICIVQEDGLMKKVNVSPVDSGQHPEVKDTGIQQGSVHSSSPSVNTGGKRAQDDTPDTCPPPVSTQPVVSTPPPPSQSSSPIIPTPGHSGAESSSSTPTDSEGASPPVTVEPVLKTARDKQYKCDLCTAVFSRLGNYTRHRKIHTLNLKEDTHFKCPHCERPFLQRCDMNRHIAVHTNQYPFRCQTCNKGYIRRSDLVVHERFHSKNRAFKCETCGRAFYQSGDLSRHKRFVHMEQSQLSCGHCQRKYASEVTLIRHIKTAHNDILLQSAAQHTVQQ
ncbi:uncharacterized protein LOC143294020 [Babylonia areolata]|uniref:uncharacterized protein LOC143294020 n=1 Tax=Babylonia areolata TaxID=304850 RepID=UPI003FD3E3CA